MEFCLICSACWTLVKSSSRSVDYPSVQPDFTPWMQLLCLFSSTWFAKLLTIILIYMFWWLSLYLCPRNQSLRGGRRRAERRGDLSERQTEHVFNTHKSPWVHAETMWELVFQTCVFKSCSCVWKHVLDMNAAKMGHVGRWNKQPITRRVLRGLAAWIFCFVMYFAQS